MVTGNDTDTVLMTIAEVAGRLKCSERHVYRLIECDVLGTVDIALPGSPSKQRVRADQLAAYIEEAERD
jgi:excisionase family DNA binding protein